MREQKCIALFHGITNVREAFIEEAQTEQMGEIELTGRTDTAGELKNTKGRNSKENDCKRNNGKESRMWLVFAVGVCVAACLIIGLSKFFQQSFGIGRPGYTEPDESGSYAVTGTKEPSEESAPPDKVSPQPTGETSSPVPVQAGPVNYSELRFSAGEANAEIMNAFGASTVDIAVFKEFGLSGCCAILEGEITDIYVKHYTYRMLDDKFGEEEPFTYRQSTVCYELSIDRVWYGGFEEGTRILIEDQMFFIDEIFIMKEGQRYVIPLWETGDTFEIHPVGKFLDGDIARDSRYSTYYPFHPQIQVTQDNCYVIPDDWESLATVPDARRINMDVELGAEGSLYKDRMFLLTADSFRAQMELLISDLFAR